MNINSGVWECIKTFTTELNGIRLRNLPFERFFWKIFYYGQGKTIPSMFFLGFMPGSQFENSLI